MARLDGRSTLAAAQGILAPGQPQVRHRGLLAVARKAALLENRGGIGVGQSLGLVHQYAQGDGLRSHLHRRRADGVGGLQRVSPLHALLTLVTVADGNVVSFR